MGLVGGAIIYQEDDRSPIVAIGVKLIHHVTPNITPHPSWLVVLVECVCLLRSPMIPKASGLLRGSNDGRFPKFCTGGVDEDSNGYFILDKLGSSHILSSAHDAAGRSQHPSNNPYSSKL